MENSRKLFRIEIFFFLKKITFDVEQKKLKMYNFPSNLDRPGYIFSAKLFCLLTQPLLKSIVSFSKIIILFQDFFFQYNWTKNRGKLYIQPRGSVETQF